MTAPPICSENELRCRSRQTAGCNSATDAWNSSVGCCSHLRAGDVQLREEAAVDDVQHLQELEPIIDDAGSQTSAPNKRLWFCASVAPLNLYSVKIHVQ